MQVQVVQGQSDCGYKHAISHLEYDMDMQHDAPVPGEPQPKRENITVGY